MYLWQPACTTLAARPFDLLTLLAAVDLPAGHPQLAASKQGGAEEQEQARQIIEAKRCKMTRHIVYISALISAVTIRSTSWPKI